MATMKVVSAMFVLLFTIGVDEGNSYQCCTNYTDEYEVYHSPETCSEYCCKELILRNYKVCCSNLVQQVSRLEMNEGSCDNDDEAVNNALIPLLATVIPLVFVVACCYYCCCKQTTRVTTVTSVFVERY